MKAPPTLNLIGSGRVGQTLATLWQRAGVFRVQDVLTRSLASARQACVAIGAGKDVATIGPMRPADVWMLAVPDAAIASAAQQLADATRQAQPPSMAPIAFHCSGAQAAYSLAPLADQGWHTASAHCILSFATPAAAMAQFAGTACALEGDTTACARLERAFRTIGAQCFTVASQDKVLYHAAAVLATNFLPVLQALAEEAWQATGVPAALLPGLRERLLRNAVDNITRLGPAAALTGPAQRGDIAAIARQAAVVRDWNPDAADAYQALSQLALRLAGHHATPDTI